MAEARLTFPKNFLWGTATSSHQMEGGNTNNNWYAWELGGNCHPGHTASQACDWWGGRWREDFDRAAEAGQNAHRFSIEWSRIAPSEGRWDESALDRYRDMARGLRARGMEPMVTLHHFTDPLWLYEQGGWETDRTAVFAAYVEKVVVALKEHVNLWVTFNEPNVYTVLGYLMGDFPPGKNSVPAAGRVMTNLVRAHAAAYHAIHRIQPSAMVGMAHQYRGLLPARNWFPPDRAIARFQSNSFNEAFPQAATTGRLRLPIGRVHVPAAKGTQDFMGLNYYTEELVRFAPFALGDFFAKRSFREDAVLSPTGFIAMEPDGFLRALRWARGFKLPIYVTENGVEDADDGLRPQYLVEHIRRLWRAVNHNWDVRGYFHWSLVDNFEWERGWTQRFGLWARDEVSQARHKRPSADLYAEICRENALTSEMVARFAPSSFQKMFPNE